MLDSWAIFFLMSVRQRHRSQSPSPHSPLRLSCRAPQAPPKRYDEPHVDHRALSLHLAQLPIAFPEFFCAASSMDPISSSSFYCPYPHFQLQLRNTLSFSLIEFHAHFSAQLTDLSPKLVSALKACSLRHAPNSIQWSSCFQRIR